MLSPAFPPPPPPPTLLSEEEEESSPEDDEEDESSEAAAQNFDILLDGGEVCRLLATSEGGYRLYDVDDNSREQ